MYEHVYKFVSPCAHIECRHTCVYTWSAVSMYQCGKKMFCVHDHACMCMYVHLCTQNFLFPHTGTWTQRSICMYAGILCEHMERRTLCCCQELHVFILTNPPDFAGLSRVLGGNPELPINETKSRNSVDHRKHY